MLRMRLMKKITIKSFIVKFLILLGCQEVEDCTPKNWSTPTMISYKENVKSPKPCEVFVIVLKRKKGKNVRRNGGKMKLSFPGVCHILVTVIIIGRVFMVVWLGTDFSRPPSPIQNQWENKVVFYIPNKPGLFLYENVPDLKVCMCKIRSIFGLTENFDRKLFDVMNFIF